MHASRSTQVHTPGPARARTWRPKNLKIIALLCLVVLLGGIFQNATASRLSERNRQKQLAESERSALRQKLATLKRNISQTETARTHAADALAQSEAAISDANRSLRELSVEQKQLVARLAALSRQEAELKRNIDSEQKQLAQLLRGQYAAGNEDRIKLLLSGDNPSRINRDLQYMGYISQAQAKLLESLRINLAAIEQNKVEAQTAKEELDEVAQEEHVQRSVLEKEKNKHAVLLSQLSGKLESQRKEAGNLQRDEQRLGGLVDKLAKLIQEQRQAELAAAEQRRKKAEQARLERQKQAASQAKFSSKGSTTTKINPDAIESDENPSASAARNELGRETSVQKNVFASSFSALRGHLRLPVRGEVKAKFGAKRGDGPTWKGLFISASEGAEVKTVAPGQIVFADWLRGFGNLIIVDHGNQYMTIYGNNQSILKHAGDTVKTGEVIASAGNSGGNEQSGLYFEMRHQGRAIDPLDWVVTR